MTDTPKQLTPEQERAAEIEKFRYQYGGMRYGFRGTNHTYDPQYIPQKTGLFPFPREDLQDDNNGNPPDLNTG